MKQGRDLFHTQKFKMLWKRFPIFTGGLKQLRFLKGGIIAVKVNTKFRITNREITILTHLTGAISFLFPQSTLL